MASSDRETLPKHIKPTHYNLSLYNLDREKFTYEGTVAIDVLVNESTSSISLNYKDIKLATASIELENEEPIEVSDFSYNVKSQVVKLTFPKELVASPGKAVLTVTFSGIMNNEMAGFYRSAYKNAHGKDDFMYSTQFESCDARKAFPCFDEPNLKATFDFSIVVPEDYTALSNQPEISSERLPNGLKKVTFETSPKMSTYLYAWACGNFEYIETHTERLYNGKKLPVRVYTTKGVVEQGRFALINAAKIVDYFSEIFHIDYPLPKVDLLAVHEFSHGAMENWGLITYRTTAVLYDESTSDSRYKNRVAYVVAHELAHQWFGNLVTMDWWSELWLNEGFATWVGWYAVDHFYPEWDVWGQFVTESLQTAFQLDSLRGSHPIEVPVKNALDIDQIFDHISYLKGSGCIRMLSTHLGVDTFLKGVSAYLKKHEYGNATTEDLWSALSEASGLDVAGFMKNWIKAIGFPVLTVTEKPGELHIKQSRFLSTGDVKPLEDETTWWVPLMLTKQSLTATADDASSLSTKEATLHGIDTAHYKLNDGQNGFYRVNYPPERLSKLGEVRKSLSVADRVGLIADAAAMALSGLGSTTGLLSFLTELKDEESYLVWAEVVEQLGKLRSVFAASSVEIEEGLKTFTLNLVTPAAEKIGWEFQPGEDFLTGRLRALLISTAGGAGHNGIIAEAKRRFKLYTSGEDRSAIHPNLRLAVFRIAVAEGSTEEYEAVVHEYLSTTTVDGREICLSALGRVKQPGLIKRVLDLTFSDKVKTQDKHTPAIALSANSHARLAFWEYIKANWETIYKQLSGNMTVLDRFLKNSLNKFATQAILDDIQRFFKDKDNSGYERGLGIIRDTVGGNINWVKRDSAAVGTWLKNNIA
ncbi:peptidase family M1-domain-containing protein [Kalaharituber pfeilii]|nr:peptidase family M1-domain-containing protein [Kalaharituber pfeilii]